MNTFGRMKPWTREVLDSANLQKVRVTPGPEIPDTPDNTVIWTRYGGQGLEMEGVLDRVSWQARCIGRQNDYESAETLADVIDIAMISHLSGSIGGVHVASIERVGGPPSALLTDEADRTHFVASYSVSVQLDLPN